MSSTRSSTRSTTRSTKINRAALVRDRRVEDDCKTLVETDQSTPVTKLKPSDSRRKKVLEPEDDEIKVVSYKDVMPRCENDGHIRIIRTVDDIEKEPADQSSKRAKRRASSSPEKSKKKVVSKFVEKERIVRKVYAVEKNVDGVSNIEKVTLEKSVKQTKEFHSQEASRARDSVTPDRKTSLEQIKEELERVKNRVDNIKNKPGQEESDSEADMMSIMKDVKQMEAEVRDISEDVDVKVKSKKRKKDKEKADSGKSKGKAPEIKRVKEDKDTEPSKKKRNNNETNKDIEIDSKLAKKILTSILGTNIGKTLNDVIRKEVDKTDHTIEKLKEDLKKQKEEKTKKKRRKEKIEDKEYGEGTNKKFKSDEGQSTSRKEKKKSSLEIEPNYVEEDRQKKKKSKKEKSRSPSRESRKKKQKGESKSVSKKKKSKSSRDKERHKKKKSKKKERKEYQSDVDHEETRNDKIVDEKEEEDEKKATQDDFELVIGITEDDVAYLEQDEVSAKEKELLAGKSDCQSGTGSNVATDNDAGGDSEDSDDEVNLRALLLSQMATRPRARSTSRAKISWPGSPKRQQSEEADSGANYALPQYAYAYSRTFITHEEKQLYFPNLFSATLVELEYSESESECEADCEEVWDQRRTTNWVSSRMSDPRFSQTMESLLRQSRDSRSPEDYGY